MKLKKMAEKTPGSNMIYKLLILTIQGQHTVWKQQSKSYKNKMHSRVQRKSRIISNCVSNLLLLCMSDSVQHQRKSSYDRCVSNLLLLCMSDSIQHQRKSRYDQAFTSWLQREQPKNCGCPKDEKQGSYTFHTCTFGSLHKELLCAKDVFSILLENILQLRTQHRFAISPS